MEPQRQQPQQHAMFACYGLAMLASGEASLCDPAPLHIAIPDHGDHG